MFIFAQAATTSDCTMPMRVYRVQVRTNSCFDWICLAIRFENRAFSFWLLLLCTCLFVCVANQIESFLRDILTEESAKHGFDYEKDSEFTTFLFLLLSDKSVAFFSSNMNSCCESLPYASLIESEQNCLPFKWQNSFCDLMFNSKLNEHNLIDFEFSGFFWFFRVWRKVYLIVDFEQISSWRVELLVERPMCIKSVMTSWTCFDGKF